MKVRQKIKMKRHKILKYFLFTTNMITVNTSSKFTFQHQQNV